MATAPSIRVVQHHLVVYKRTWRGSVVFSFLTPVLYLAAMGIGLGSLIKGQGRQSLGGVSYLTFVAPGLLAASVMQVATAESMFPIMGGIKWLKTYDAMLATPIRIRDLVTGQFLWIAIRLLLVAAAYTLVIALFGITTSATAVFAIPAAVLCGMAFSTPIAAFVATQENDQNFIVLFRLVVMPLFLFSGSFFPITRLPWALQQVARVTPLWHGVELCRAFVLGDVAFVATCVHIVYLTVWMLAGWWVANGTFAKRLRP